MLSAIPFVFVLFCLYSYNLLVFLSSISLLALVCNYRFVDEWYSEFIHRCCCRLTTNYSQITASTLLSLIQRLCRIQRQMTVSDESGETRKEAVCFKLLSQHFHVEAETKCICRESREPKPRLWLFWSHSSGKPLLVLATSSRSRLWESKIHLHAFSY